MKHRGKVLFLFAFLTTLFVLYTPSLISNMTFIGFAGLITLLIHELTLPYALLSSLLLGLIIDIYSMSSFFGVTPLNYTLTTLFLYRYRKYFSLEKITIFPLFSILFSLLSTLFQFFFMALFEESLKLSFLSFLTDFLLMPILDGVYAFLFPLLPWRFLHFLNDEKQKIMIERWLSAFKNQWHKIRSSL